MAAVPIPTEIAKQPGILAQQTTAAQTAPATLATANTASLTQAAIDENLGTVQGQTSKIIDANSPLMQRAAAAANVQSADNGTLNSSMAVGAAQGAVMDRAVPIAAQDASAHNQFSLQNMQEANTTARTNAGILTGVSQSNAALDTQNKQFNVGQGNTVSLANTAAVNRATEFNASSAQQVDLANAAAKNAAAIATANNLTQIEAQTMAKDTQIVLANLNNSDAAKRAGQQNTTSLMAQYQASYVKILTDTTLGAEAKDKAISLLRKETGQSLAIIGGAASDPAIIALLAPPAPKTENSKAEYSSNKYTNRNVVPPIPAGQSTRRGRWQWMGNEWKWLMKDE